MKRGKVHVLSLTRYGRLGASSRLRFLQYLSPLRELGLEISVSSFLGDKYISALQIGRRSFTAVVGGYLQRIALLLYARNYDLLWIEKEALPWLPACLELGMLPKSMPYVLDYDDAVFHYYDLHRSGWVNWFLGDKHKKLMSNAALVVAGNPYIAEYAKRAGAPLVEIVPTVVDISKYPNGLITSDSESKVPTVGWIGSVSTSKYLEIIAEPMRQLATSGRARFVAIGAGADASLLPVEVIDWHENSEVANIANFDIGIMPLVDGPFERGKCGYKLLQYMACSKPVVASPVGINTEIVDHGINGFLATTPNQWLDALEILLADASLREQMGRKGRQKVESFFSLNVTAPRLAGLLQQAAETSHSQVRPTN